ncbi:putative sulfate permease [Cladophialophora carrionii]|uniref:Putative sulfate permease n=1 Tax=Cladophialophora carrionii TaxID=86049 RepID=A0A1C1CXX6_9EURO|nr:putative sulfate permease [Cladophialophora carrionii]
MKLYERIKDDVKNDVNWNRVARVGVRGLRATPSAAKTYVTDKVPIIGWLPRYNYRWLLTDFVAGLTLSLMLIPQSLAYAKIAKIPVQYGLMSSWSPAVIYTFMGTSKDMSTGPTSLIGLLTSDVVDDLVGEGYSPEAISSAVALMMGICMAAMGFLKLGFLLDFISYPVLTGFISAVAITIGLGQVDNLIGEENVGDGTANIIHDVLTNFGTCNGRAAGMGIASVVLLVGLQKAGERWGSKNKVIWFISITRAFIALLLFTGISYGVNKGRAEDDYLFDVSEVPPTRINAPKPVDAALLGKAAGGSIAAFLGASIEHVAIARAFGLRNNYVTDPSQELCYLGVTNIWNSFFTCMGVGGAMSRTAVNSQCQVKSPLSGVVTTGVIVLALYKWTGALYWVPKATLAAIIITAIWPLIGKPSTYYHFWKTSLADFIASMIAFWVSLFVSTEIGIGSAVGFNVAYVLLRQVFIRISTVSADSRSELAASLDAARGMPPSIPPDTRVFRFEESFFFPNVQRIKRIILDTVQTYHSPEYNSRNGEEAERNWSVEGERRIARLRKKANIETSNLPPINVVILDFAKVNFFDTSAVIGLKNFLAELKQYAGKGVEVRLVALNGMARERFERAGWTLLDADSSMDTSKPTNVRVFPSVGQAVQASRAASEIVEVIVKNDESSEENTTVSHREKM